MTQQPRTVLLTTKEVAELAKVDASTVSNWRRRFDTFPKPALTDDAGKRPKFASHEVEKWLRENPQVGADRPTTQRGIAYVLDLLRGRIPFEQAVHLIGPLMVKIERERRRAANEPIRGAGGFDPVALSGHSNLERALPAETIERLVKVLSEIEDLASAYEELLAAVSSRVNFAGEDITPDSLAEFINELLPPNAEGAVIDLAAGHGTLLLACLRKGKAKSGLGIEINQWSAEAAQQRIYLARAAVEIVQADAFDANALGSRRGDVVLVDPPLNMQLSPVARARQSWDFGTPKPSNGDTAWLQAAVDALNPGGRAIVVTGIGTLFQTDRATVQVRNEMVRRGAVQAVFTLPARVRSNTAARLAVWVLTTPDGEDRRDSVLLVDLGTADRAKFAVDSAGARAWKHWTANPQAELDPSVAVAVPVIDLLAPDATLLPSKWTTIAEESISGSEWAQRAKAAQNKAVGTVQAGLALPTVELVAATAHRPKLTFGDLQRRGDIAIIKGRHMERDRDSEDTLPLLSVREARQQSPDPEAAAERVAADETAESQLVQPGDVLVYPDKDEVVARVWDDSGWVLGRFMQAVRVTDNSWNPHYLAAAINNPSNARHLRDGVVRTHFKLADFEIFEANDKLQQAAERIDRQFASVELRLVNAADTVEVARREILAAIASGQTEAAGR